MQLARPQIELAIAEDDLLLVRAPLAAAEKSTSDHRPRSTAVIARPANHIVYFS